ncbi:MAG: VCBS repeat-containing protein, partial [Saprospiraceae bacterium]|nr:VCBS repeat-containing protein [Saprospiraceae bacterium]
GGPGNPTGTGAKIRVRAGNRQFFQEMTPARGFYSSVEPIFQLGLGKLKSADEVAVEWPGGKIQVLQNVAANQRLQLDIADAQPGRLARGEPYQPLFSPLPPGQLPAWTHRENEFEDFNRERLLLHRFSRSGPCLAVGDANGDGLDDLFAGGAAGQPGLALLQQPDGRLLPSPQPALDADAGHEDTGALWFDADADGDADLYVVSGSNEAPAGDTLYQDRLYRNDGRGRLSRDRAALPLIRSSGSAVRAHDFDGDGDLDLVVGGRVTPGRFPETPATLVLLNDGKGRFSQAPPALSGPLAQAGMVTDVLFADLDGDRRAELVLCGEWMPIRVFQFDGKTFADRSAAFGFEDTGGLWNCLEAHDLDGDGDLDLVAGNEGLNTRLEASSGAPLRLFALDFDINQSLDPVVAVAHAGRYYPLAQRNELAAQMPTLIKSKFLRYRAYAQAPLEEVLEIKKLRAAQQLAVHRLESCWFENRNGRFFAHPLPLEAQISCTKKIVTHDFNADRRPDLLLLGNDVNNTPETGPYDASRGILLLGDGRGGWQFLPNHRHGLWARGEARAAGLLRRSPAGGFLLVVGFNSASLQAWRLEYGGG